MRELGSLIKALGLNMGSEEINNAMVDLDKDRNGAISFDEFWGWFQTAATIKYGTSSSPSKTPAFKMKTQMWKAMDETNHKGSEDHDATKSVSRRPQTAMSRSSSKVGSWKTRGGGYDSPVEGSEHLAGRIRPSTAMERHSSGGDKAWGSVGWRSVTRTDYRPPSAGGRLQPPRLNLPHKQRPARPSSAQPLIRAPGAPQCPVGSTSGFRL